MDVRQSGAERERERETPDRRQLAPLRSRCDAAMTRHRARLDDSGGSPAVLFSSLDINIGVEVEGATTVSEGHRFE